MHKRHQRRSTVNIQNILKWTLLSVISLSCSFSALAEDLFQRLKVETACESSHAYASGMMKLYCAESTPIVQSYVDEAVEILMQTNFGQAICSRVLGRTIENIERHLGVSRSSAAAISYSCRPKPDPQWPQAVHSSEGQDGLEKLSLAPMVSKRSYTLVVSSNQDLPFDSWTAPVRNNTMLVLGEEPPTSKSTRDFLIQLLAHEMAIYFDAQITAGTDAWQELPPNKGVSFDGARTQEVIRALNNPLIALVLSSIRAFKVERAMISELQQQHLVDLDLGLEYSEEAFPFFSSDCDDVCLYQYVEREAEKQIPLSLPLVAYTPLYKSLLSKSLAPYGSLSGPQKKRYSDAKSILKRATEYFMEQKGTNLTGLNLLLPILDLFEEKLSLETQQALGTLLLPADLEVLRRAKISGSNQSVLEFVTQPILSRHNIHLSQGPRPRIRTGNTRNVY